MKNIVDYLKQYNDVGFDELPFNEVDGLILSQFSYFRWDRKVPGLLDGADGVRLCDMCENLDKEYVYLNEYYPEENEALLNAMLAGKRYRTMKCNYCSEDTSEDVQMQFGAITFFPEGAEPVVAFRGTDSTLIGWRENFNMAFSKPVAGQRRAAVYLKQVALRINGSFIVVGHSKGGNLATFSAMTAPLDIKNRIREIISYDGPGFRPEILLEYNYDAIETKVIKMIPEASVVGVILEGDARIITIQSDGMTGAFQHNPFNWEVENAQFVRSHGIKKTSVLMHESLNEWVMRLDEGQLKIFADTLFKILQSSQASTIPQLASNWRTVLPNIFNAATNVDKETRQNTMEIFRALFDSLNDSEKKIRDKQ